MGTPPPYTGPPVSLPSRAPRRRPNRVLLGCGVLAGLTMACFIGAAIIGAIGNLVEGRDPSPTVVAASTPAGTVALAGAVSTTALATTIPAPTAVASPTTIPVTSTTQAPTTVAAAPTVAPTAPPRPTNTPQPAQTPRPPTVTPTPRPPTATPVPPTPTVPPVPAETQTLQGRGVQASGPLTLKTGLTFFRFTHTGQRNYIVRLLDADARLVDLLVNVIGAYDGTTAMRIPRDGQYTLNIEADGAWTADILQPGRAELAGAVPLPQTFSGQGANITPFFNGNTGGLRLVLRHSGQRNFIVRLLDSRGQTVDLSANVIGPHEGSKVVRLPGNGQYLLVIEADGAWSIEAGQ